MKISNFQLLDEEADELSVVLTQFNQTTTDYPREQTIHRLFDEVAAQHPDRVAVCTESGETITYKRLQEEADRMAQFLHAQGVQPEEAVAILLEPSVHQIVALLGILKAGGMYVPLHADFPLERQKFILTDTAARILISEKKYIKTLHKLQWECEALKRFVCVDSDNIHTEPETANELMKKELWDYVGEEAADDIEGGGWVNSYTGENLSRQVMDEYGDNILHKLKPLLRKTDKVLEIGCSSGISMFRLAPLVESYYGTDLSDEILKKTESERARLGMENIHLKTLPAHKVDEVGERDFDLIIINSVIQCFNGYNYLRDVLAKALSLLKEEGKLFLGDLMDQDQKQALVDSLIAFKKEHLGQGYTTKTDWSNELFLSRRYVEDLQHDFPEIVFVEHSEKIGQQRSELSEFRFDSLLTVRKNTTQKPDLQPRHKYQLSRPDVLRHPATPLPELGTASSLAYSTFTSGTTGKPNGVLIEHRSVVRLVRDTNYIDIQPTDRLTQLAPLSFDASTFEIWGALLNGASLCVIRKETVLDVEALETLLKTYQITIGWLTSPLFHQLVELAPQLFRYYKTLLVGGDVTSPMHVRKARQVNPDLEIINAYGPTENTTFSTCFPIKTDLDAAIPIGKPISNTRCYILKENNPDQIVPVGIPGELYLAGDGLARSYLNRPELTQSRFVTHPRLSETRLYKTGDRVKWLPDGSIEFLGRIDEQVKIRGFRVELKEIEGKLLDIPGVKEAAVLVYEPQPGDKQLAAYVVTDDSITPDDLKASLIAFLPDYMIPACLISMPNLPLNENGKVDKKALPPPTRPGSKDSVAPRTATEEQLAAIWKSILGVSQLGVYDDFFALGGHSLKATQLISRVLEEMHVKISIREMFSYPTIAGMADLLVHKEQSQQVVIEPVAQQPYYPVSHAQKRLWVLNQFSKDQIVYNMPGVYALRNIDSAAFTNAIYTLVERHESLRTTFALQDDQPVQRIHSSEASGFKVVVQDVRDNNYTPDQLAQLAQQEAQTPFDLERGPLFRATLLQTADNEWLFLYTLHHSICDGWSLGVLIEEVIALYEAFSQGKENPLPPLRIQYKDYAAWQQHELTGPDRDEHRNFWLQHLQDPLPVLDLYTDFPRPAVQSFRGDKVTQLLEPTQTQALRQLCQRQQVTPFMAFVAVVQVLLYKYTFQKDILLGTPVNGRVHKDLEKQIGFFVNMLVLRTPLEPDEAFTQYLQRTRQHILQAFEHQVYPFDVLLNDLNVPRNPSRSPLFDVQVTTQMSQARPLPNPSPDNRPTPEVEVEDRDADLNIGSKYDLIFKLLDQGEAMHLHILYNSDLFRNQTILLLKERLLTLLADVLQNPEKSIQALNMQTAFERPSQKIEIETEFDF